MTLPNNTNYILTKYTGVSYTESELFLQYNMKITAFGEGSKRGYIPMYECPSCAAALRYDIDKQMLSCDHCGNTLDPYAFQKDKDAEEHTD